MIKVVARSIWVIILFLAVAALLARFTIALTSEISLSGTVHLVALIALIYLLFLFEGLQHCAIQIKGADSDGVDEFITSNVSQRRRAHVAGSASLFRVAFDQFLTGRNMCSMIAIVAIAFVIDTMPFSAQNSVYALADQLSPLIKPYLDKFLHSFYAIFILSTLLPCWIGQLLPQLMADGRSIEFMQLVFARQAASLAVFVAWLETGWPSEMVYGFIKKRGAFNVQEKFRVGEEALFEKTSELFNAVVNKREINLMITPTDLSVRDRSHINLQEKTSTIGHVLRFASPKGRPMDIVGVQFRLPVRHDEPRAKILLIETDQLQGTERKALAREIVYRLETTAELQLPRSADDAVMLDIDLTQAAPSSNDDNFYVYVIQPTRLMIIDIKTEADNLFVTEPVVVIDILEETSGLGLGKPSISRRQLQTPLVKQIESGWSITVNFPPIHSRVSVQLDVRSTGPKVPPEADAKKVRTRDDTTERT